MYNPIRLTYIPGKELERQQRNILSIHPVSLLTEADEIDFQTEIYSEAVFTNGKNSLTVVVEQIQKIKDQLDFEISQHEKVERSKKKQDPSKFFDPKKFWKHQLFKELENQIRSIFGFRNVEIHPVIEKYDSKEKIFESKSMNCEIGHMVRYPIDGLVTNKGFYDSTHSLTMRIFITLGLIKQLRADEILAVLLHEFGHSIDPAVVDINYVKTNILSKYLTDRENEMTAQEKKFDETVKKKFDSTLITPILGSLAITMSAVSIASFFKFIIGKVSKTMKRKIEEREMRQHELKMEHKIEKIREMIQNDKEFTKRDYSEAFADNFARMYGFGVPLATGIKKMDKDLNRKIRTRLQKETDRQKAILNIVESSIKGEHKTNIHRIRSLIKEYEDDLKNPNISNDVKKNIQEDMNELKLVFDSYTKSFSRFQNKINKVIIEELDKLDKQKSEVIKESIELFEEKKKREHNSLTPKEREEVEERFGKIQCSIFKDENGEYFATTHRACTKSYPSIQKLPKKEVNFVSSTS